MANPVTPDGKDTPEYPDDERIDVVVEKAQDAFWAVVAEEFPECTFGDFGPSESFRWDDAATNAVKAWVRNNHPQDEEVD